MLSEFRFLEATIAPREIRLPLNRDLDNTYDLGELDRFELVGNAIEFESEFTPIRIVCSEVEVTYRRIVSK